MGVGDKTVLLGLLVKILGEFPGSLNGKSLGKSFKIWSMVKDSGKLLCYEKSILL